VKKVPAKKPAKGKKKAEIQKSQYALHQKIVYPLHGSARS